MTDKPALGVSFLAGFITAYLAMQLLALLIHVASGATLPGYLDDLVALVAGVITAVVYACLVVGARSDERRGPPPGP